MRSSLRHPGEGRGPDTFYWIPAFAGMTAILAVLMMIGSIAHADVSISAQVDRNSVSLNDQVTLLVTVSGNGSSLPQPTLPNLPHFSIYSSGQNQSISFINGQVSSSIVYTYVLAPRAEGQWTIPPIGIDVQGHRQETSPITISVGQAAVPPPASAPQNSQAAPQASAGAAAQAAAQPAGPAAPDTFITSEIDKKKAYVNEEAILTVRFFTAVNLLNNPQYEPPALSGFLSEDLPPERHGNTQIHGRPYYFSEIKTVLFPAEAGKLTIGPATVHVQIPKSVAVDPFAQDFFNRFFSQGLVSSEPKTLQSQPLTFTALALPEAGKPGNFSGAVGSFSISASVDKNKVHVGDAVNLTITIEGKGNIKSIEAPKLASLASFRVYDTIGATNIRKDNDLIQGSKVFKTVLVPTVAGQLTIPSVSFSYFDARRESYVTAGSSSISLSVAPATPGSNPAVSYIPSGAQGTNINTQGPGITVVNQDIRYLKTSPHRSLLNRVLTAVASAGFFHVIPFLFFGIAFGRNKIEEQKARDPKRIRFRQAQKIALQTLKEAENSTAQSPQQSSNLMAEAFTRYLADKLGVAPSGLTWRSIQDALQNRSKPVSTESLAKARQMWEYLDMRRFAPSTQDTAVLEEAIRLSASIRDLIAHLEKEMTS